MGWVYNRPDPGIPPKALKVIVVTTCFTALAAIFVGLRLFVRIAKLRSHGFDDAMVTASLLFSIGYTADAIYLTRWGLGVDLDEFPPINTIDFGKVQYAGSPLYVSALLGFKLALLWSYLRIIAAGKTYRRCIFVIMGACIANHLVFCMVLLFACRPISRQWDPTLDGRCINTVASYYALAATTLFFDILTIGAPLPLLLRLKIPSRKKVILMILFMLGFFVTLIQAVRIFSIKNLKQYIDSHNLILWSIVEVNLGITLTCIPTLAPLFSYYRGSVHAQTTSWSSTSATRKGSRKSTSPRSHVYNRSVSHQAHDRDKSANLDYTLSDMDSRAHLPGGNLPLSSTRTDTVRHGHCHTGVVTAGKMSNNKMGIAMRLGKEGAVGIPRDGGSEEGLVRPEDGIMKTREVLVERQDRSPGWNVV